jgi:hypothetical protein
LIAEKVPSFFEVALRIALVEALRWLASMIGATGSLTPLLSSPPRWVVA